MAGSKADLSENKEFQKELSILSTNIIEHLLENNQTVLGLGI
jgi:hypothetical protein